MGEKTKQKINVNHDQTVLPFDELCPSECRTSDGRIITRSEDGSFDLLKGYKKDD